MTAMVIVYTEYIQPSAHQLQVYHFCLWESWMTSNVATITAATLLSQNPEQ